MHSGPAMVRFTKTHVMVLCPMGHLETARRLGQDFVGSFLEARITEHQVRRNWIIQCHGAEPTGRIEHSR